MKLFQKLILFMMAVAVTSSFTSCKKDDLPNGGKPSISYVRVTNPQSSDSLLIGAGQGNLIAIMGENLGKAQRIWFNDKEASLIPTYITNSSILVHVPTEIPTEITNKLKISFSNGDSLLYDFQVQISKPVLNSMVSEFVNVGDVATIRGDYFYPPLKVIFTGGDTGTVVSVTDQEIQFRVPADAQPGPI